MQTSCLKQVGLFLYCRVNHIMLKSSLFYLLKRNQGIKHCYCTMVYQFKKIFISGNLHRVACLSVRAYISTNLRWLKCDALMLYLAWTIVYYITTTIKLVPNLYILNKLKKYNLYICYLLVPDLFCPWKDCYKQNLKNLIYGRTIIYYFFLNINS